MKTSNYPTGQRPQRTPQEVKADWIDRERDECDAQWRELEAAIRDLSDADLLGHAVRVVAAKANVAAFLDLAHPRKSKGLWAQVAERLRAGIGPFEDFAAVRVQPKGRAGGFKPIRDWPFETVALTQHQIDTATLAVAAVWNKGGTVTREVPPQALVAAVADTMVEEELI